MNSFKFPMPDIGEGVAEGELVEWHVAVGDQVAEDDVLCEVMTDKATVEIPSPIEGKVTALHAESGQVVPVGFYLLTIEYADGAHVPTVARHGEHDDDDDHGGGGGDAVAAAAGDAEETQETAPPASSSGSHDPGEDVTEQIEPEDLDEVERPDGERALATPYTRKLARTLGVDLERIRGTGEIGRVTPEDVTRYAEGRKSRSARAPDSEAVTTQLGLAEEMEDTGPFTMPATKAPSTARAAPPRRAPTPIPAGERETRVPIRGVRKKIAERMSQSKNTAAHFTYVDEVDVTRLVDLRRRLKPVLAEQGVKLTYLPFIMKAVVSGLRRFPNLNGLTDDANQEFVVKHYRNLGVAVDTDAGLMVPVVKDVDSLSIAALASEIDRVAIDARNGKSKLEDLKDGTFTITNAGNIGGLFATPVINYPEAAILGVHTIKQKPWIVDGEIVVRSIMYLSISIDHRMNDGAVGAYFMNHVIALLEDPDKLMLEL